MNVDDFAAGLNARAQIAGVVVDAQVVLRLFAYLGLLRRWNPIINLTSLPLEPPTDETFDRLLVEPLVVAAKLPDEPVIWFDLGSGGGSPALPIKLSRPGLALTMVESRERKAAFLREAIRALEISGARVENVRFEALRSRADMMGSAGLITIRAVRIDAEILSVCSGLLTTQGLLIPFGFGGTELPGFERDSRTGFFRYVPRGTEA